MPNKTCNIKEYRKQYYLENRDHLLLYQKMYVFYKKLEMKYKIDYKINAYGFPEIYMIVLAQILHILFQALIILHINRVKVRN